MNFKVWINDPKLKEPSISLTLMLISFTLVVTGCILEMLGKVKGISSLPELFYATAGLYFGRRFNIGGKVIGQDKEV